MVVNYRFYNNFRKNWPMSRGWAYLKVTAKPYYSAWGNSFKRSNSNFEDHPLVYVFMADTDTIYHLIKSKDVFVNMCMEKGRQLTAEWNDLNSHGNYETLHKPEVRDCLDFREGSKHRTYLMLVHSTWHYSDYLSKSHAFTRMSSDCSNIKLQLKYASKDFNPETKYKYGGLTLWLSDLTHLLNNKQVLKVMSKVEADPRIKLRSVDEYNSSVSARLSEPHFTRQIVADLKPASVALQEAEDEASAMEKRQKRKRKKKGALE